MIVATLSETLNDRYYFTTFGLSSGYHHIKIHLKCCKFLGFEWIFEDGCTKYYQFFVLRFGLSSACYLKHWRGIDIKAIIFIDDGIVATLSFKLAKTASEVVKNDRFSAGFVINVEKSDFNPKTKEKWLGTIIDTVEMTFTVPIEKINKLLADIQNILKQNFFAPTQLAKLAG